ncbi:MULTISPECIES: hypothetical protein [Nostocales]
MTKLIAGGKCDTPLAISEAYRSRGNSKAEGDVTYYYADLNEISLAFARVNP